MTIEEYIRTVNGLFGSEPLTAEQIETVGFIDIVPKMKSIYESEVSFTIKDGNIISKRTFKDEEDENTLEKATPLNDDISLHSGDLGSVKEVIVKTLDALAELDLMNGADYKNRIDAFNAALEKIEQVDKESSSIKNN